MKIKPISLQLILQPSFYLSSYPQSIGWRLKCSLAETYMTYANSITISPRTISRPKKSNISGKKNRKRTSFLLTTTITSFKLPATPSTKGVSSYCSSMKNRLKLWKKLERSLFTSTQRQKTSISHTFL